MNQKRTAMPYPYASLQRHTHTHTRTDTLTHPLAHKQSHSSVGPHTDTPTHTLSCTRSLLRSLTHSRIHSCSRSRTRMGRSASSSAGTTRCAISTNDDRCTDKSISVRLESRESALNLPPTWMNWPDVLTLSSTIYTRDR
jgi:hypothetical protein